MEFLSAKGFWVFLPRYRGSWESGGRFLRFSPHRDILDCMNGIEKGFRECERGKRFRIVGPDFFLIGGSFGGPAALLVSRDSRVKKVMLAAPVVDWRRIGPAEPMAWMGKRFIPDAFGEGYRYSLKDWNKLGSGSFYNPIDHKNLIDGRKILILQAKDDNVVLAKNVVSFANEIKAKLVLLKRGGHVSFKRFMEPLF